MTTKEWLQYLAGRSLHNKVQNTKNKRGKWQTISNLQGVFLSSEIALQFQDTLETTLCILPNKETAEFLYSDLEQLVGKEHCVYFPESYIKPYDFEQIDNSNILYRTEVLLQLSQQDTPSIIVTFPEALSEKVVHQQELSKQTQHIKKGAALDRDFLAEYLMEYGFERCSSVYEPGQFAVRGEIIDVFSYGYDQPCRIQFFDEEIERIRIFDPANQRTIKEINSWKIVPLLGGKEQKSSRISLLESLPNNALIWLVKPEVIMHKIQHSYRLALEEYSKLEDNVVRSSPDKLYIDKHSFEEQLLTFQGVEIASDSVFGKSKPLALQIHRPPIFQKNFETLATAIEGWHESGKLVYILCGSSKQLYRFEEILESQKIPKEWAQCILLDIHEGGIHEELVILTDHQIFGRFHKARKRHKNFKKNAFSIEEMMKLRMGDFVSHIDHGIGKFGGLQKIDVNGKMQDAVKLLYDNNDILYVSIHSLHKIARFQTSDGTPPTLHKIGSKKWSTLKEKSKSKIKLLAFDLIETYAKRKKSKGFAFSQDNYLMHELESSFIYEETEDQQKAIEDVKQDMESPFPMDRLVCGDVGFGKTEVAIRAAFKAVCDSKQVAVLVPTTILAVQHYKTFKKRLEGLPVRIDFINRFKTKKEQNATVAALKSGEIDILIGTHRIVNKDIQFADLGLLIIDEEQKFGVNVKEKLRSVAHNIDVLTLTATPIPRTLQFSLLSARDLSIMNTPPSNRQPVSTTVTTWSDEVLRDAIYTELQRGGQVFMINNRIANLPELTGKILHLFPDAHVDFGHGQMTGNDLERKMVSFIEGETDVFVSTTIVENGLDVPNANTIFIVNAHQYGLSELHQMRGRVGRSNTKAFCYLLAPPLIGLPEESRRRLQAMEQHTDLGSGFQIALKDLEIRGAGNLLGGEQSGFINTMGFDTYQKILKEAIDELKYEQFQETEFEQNSKEISCQLDTDIEAYLPHDYVNEVSERLSWYRRFAALKDANELKHWIADIEDKFGALPPEAKQFTKTFQARYKAQELGLEKLRIKGGVMSADFRQNLPQNFSESTIFRHVLETVQRFPKRMRIAPKGASVSLKVTQVKTLEDAVSMLDLLQPEEFSTQ